MNPAYEFTSHEDIEAIKGGTVTDVWNASIDKDQMCLAIHISTPDGGSHSLMFDEEGPWHYRFSVDCTECSSENDSDALYCKRCGNKLPDRVEQLEE